MSTAEAKPEVPEEEVAEESSSPMMEWLTGTATQAWAASMMIHLIILLVMALVLGTIQVVKTVVNAPSFETAQTEAVPEPEITAFEVGETPLDPTELTTETLELTEAPPVEAQFNDNSAMFEEAGGGSATANPNALGAGVGFDVKASGLGPMVRGGGGIDGGVGLGKNPGKGGAGSGFGSRGSGMREAMVGNGGTKASERAVAAALNWISRHQNQNGSWSLDHRPGCKNGACSGSGEVNSNAAATAMALLPFFAAGQTHESRGPYQRHITGGLMWLINNQKPNGDLSAGSSSQMYTHGLCTIALCEAYGMSQDSRIGLAAQAAINFIQTGQNKEGSWRYSHGSDDSDTSVHGWQVMALKSGQMAGLQVSDNAVAGSKNYMKLVGKGGRYKELFAYTPEGGPTLSMTAVGLLCTQYLGAQRDDPVITGGVEYLGKNLPSETRRNVYYWYYATQVMHNVPGPEWDTWNRAMRKILINTQDKQGCAAGSWDPLQPSPDAWGRQGGRLMVTSLSCLTLEVYYRYLPLYKLNKKDAEKDLK
ncbi:prenyltransferase/squalene oxidase repeat-containing protein [Anatilimnocola floriformis]|uniref:prenyltransferase/squalene oxidase repeat-containing protein n=1 Tax=Anatilimnocola floriformis TaxID=2948575 RepID=UPI0020C2CB4A|nr:prenyltransferase/squalene oxidase repeat-containing protein [Anatilimnocola floriformis]